MERDEVQTPTHRAWRYKTGGAFVFATGLLALWSYRTLPHGGSLMHGSTIDALHRSAFIAMAALGCLTIGLSLIAAEAMRRHDDRVEASSPVSRTVYLATLQRMLRQAQRHPTNPVDPDDARRLLELLEEADLAHAVGFKLVDKGD